MHIHRNTLAALCALFAAASAYGQAPATKQFRSDAMKAMVSRIQNKHFDPRAFDDTYSAALWKRYLEALDPDRVFFLQEDISRLRSQELDLDDQLKNGTTAFFDSVFAIYTVRRLEAESLCLQTLATIPDFNRKETWPKPSGFCTNVAERKDRWGRLIKYHLLRNYMELSVAAGNAPDAGAALNTAIMTKARDKVRQWYKDQFAQAAKPGFIDERFTLYLAMAAFEVDPHTIYSAPKDKTLENQLNKRYYGLGMELAARDADYYIKRLLPGGTAAKSGQVKENDNILAVSDKDGNMIPTAGLTALEVGNMIRGEKDSEVKLELQHPGEKARTVAVKRDEVVDMENRAKAAIIEKGGHKYGYIQLPLFYVDPTGRGITGAAGDMAREMSKLRDEEVEGLVIDLRGNGGGSLDEVVRMCGSFLNGGPISWLRSREQVNKYALTNGTPMYQGPLTVLVDEASASASEIFAAVMQDRKRAIIVGPSSTYGKGTAQIQLNLGKMGDTAKGIADISYGSMRLTVQKFYRVNGTATQLRGVVPDVIVQPKMVSNIEMEKDFSSKLLCDTIKLEPFDTAAVAYDYRQVVNKARKRVAENEAFSAIVNNMTRLTELAASPVPLDLSAYRQYYLQNTQLENDIRNAKTLPAGQTLQVQLAEYKNLRPDVRPDDPASRSNQEWMQKLSQDRYVAETISILQDMLSH